jgi:hypothetical protein
VIGTIDFDLIRRLLPAPFRYALSKHYAMAFSAEMLEEDDNLQPLVFEETEGT